MNKILNFLQIFLVFLDSGIIFNPSYKLQQMRKYLLILFSFVLIGVSQAGLEDGIAGDPFLKEFSVYPNPSTGDFTVSMSSLDPNARLSLKVYSIIGQEMYSMEVNPFNGIQKVNLNLDKLPKGVYMVEISNGVQAKTKRITLI